MPTAHYPIYTDREPVCPDQDFVKLRFRDEAWNEAECQLPIEAVKEVYLEYITPPDMTCSKEEEKP